MHVYVEITPFDTLKYEVDKASGYLRLDRPQVSSSVPPVPYGFIPSTYCGPRVSALSAGTTRGDGDPLDVCVFSERPINRAEVLLTANVVGGIRTTERDEADDKMIAVLANDLVWGEVARRRRAAARARRSPAPLLRHLQDARRGRAVDVKPCTRSTAASAPTGWSRRRSPTTASASSRAG